MSVLSDNTWAVRNRGAGRVWKRTLLKPWFLTCSNVTVSTHCNLEFRFGGRCCALGHCQWLCRAGSAPLMGSLGVSLQGRVAGAVTPRVLTEITSNVMDFMAVTQSLFYSRSRKGARSLNSVFCAWSGAYGKVRSFCASEKLEHNSFLFLLFLKLASSTPSLSLCSSHLASYSARPTVVAEIWVIWSFPISHLKVKQ